MAHNEKQKQFEWTLAYSAEIIAYWYKRCVEAEQALTPKTEGDDE